MNLPRTSWKLRRRTMFVVLAFNMSVILLALMQGADTRVADTAVVMASGSITLILLGYVFGATVEDIQRLKLIAKGGGDDL